MAFVLSVYRLIGRSIHLLAHRAPNIINGKVDDVRFIVVNGMRTVFGLNPSALPFTTMNRTSSTLPFMMFGARCASK